MKKIYLFCLVASVLLLAGCGMSKEECAVTDWKQVGFNDGLAGKQPRNLTSAAKDCISYGIAVDQAAYRNGWDSGIHRYCTKEQGFTIGAQGSQLPTICPANLQSTFAAGWKSGIKSYCSEPKNGFEAGKSGAPMPSLCAQHSSALFASEYNRGNLVYQQINKNQQMINDLQTQIDRKAQTYHLAQSLYNGNIYKLTDIVTPAAMEALDNVNQMGAQRSQLEGEVNRLKSTS